MKFKTFLAIILFIIPATGIFLTQLHTAEASTTIFSVYPTLIEDPALQPGSYFRINITVADVQMLWGFQFNVSYNTNVLTATSYGLFMPFQEFAPSGITDAQGNVGIAAYTYAGDRTGLTTIAPWAVCWIEFLIDSPGSSTLDLHDSILASTGGTAIPHVEVDGSFGFPPQGIIRILYDGSVDPSTAPISREGNTYFLTANIYDATISVECSGIIVDGNGFKLLGTRTGAGILILNVASSVTIRNMDIMGFGTGINDAGYSSTLTDNVITSNSEGIFTYLSQGAVVSRNSIVANSKGIHLVQTSGSVISENILANNQIAIEALYSSGNWVNNTMTYNSAGIAAHFSGGSIVGNNISSNLNTGILLDDVSSTSVSANILEHNGVGVQIIGYAELTGISITANTFAYNNAGLEIGAAMVNNLFYHNNFINNVQQVSYPYPRFNYWDNGYPFGGNFWSDYAGVDLHNGQYQNLTGSDGIGDSPYVVALDNTDRYPFMTPFNTTEFFALRITATSGGTTSPEPGLHVYEADSTTDVLAIPETDYLFDHWELDDTNAGTTNPTSVIMNTNHVLNALFKPRPDIAVTLVTARPNSVKKGEPVYIEVTLENQRYTTETFSVIVYADKDKSVIGDEIVIGTNVVYNLAPGTSTTTSFIWQTASLSSGGTYYISAKAIVPYDIDLADNLLTAKKRVTVRH